MDFNEYQVRAWETEIISDEAERFCTRDDAVSSLKLTYLTLKLNGEAGEVAEIVGKSLRGRYSLHEKEHRDKILRELGDVLWYVAGIATELGAELDMVAYMNLRKLQQREKEGTLHGFGSDR